LTPVSSEIGVNRRIFEQSKIRYLKPVTGAAAEEVEFTAEGFAEGGKSPCNNGPLVMTQLSSALLRQIRDFVAGKK
jgi:hypothetical protein